MRGKLITLSGIDGAGKTTIANELVNKFEQEGYSASYHYGRYDYNLALPVMILGEKLVQSGTKDVRSGSEEDFDEYTENKRDFLDNPVLKNLYELVSMADYLPFLNLSINYKLMNNDYVISDRYLYDTILKNLGGKIDNSPEAAIKRIKQYEKIIPRPDYAYYLDISAETALNRKDDIPSTTLIQEQEAIYESVIPMIELFRINAEQRPDAVIEEIYNDVIQE